ncbi:MAG: glycoside hydrolase family 2 TIM barrel-domain containing protein [Niabella sp.]
MKIINVCLIILLLSCWNARGQDHLIQHIWGRTLLSLNGKWNYIVDPYESGFYNYRREPFDQSPAKKGGFYEDRTPAAKNDLVEYDFDRSPTLQVPADWNSQYNELKLYEGTVWYRKKFDMQPKSGRRYVLYFGAVNYEAQVYLNGTKLGIHEGGFTPFQFEITGLLKNGENIITVKADNTRKKDGIPSVNTDWWNYGGITRDVWITELPETYINDYHIQVTRSEPGLIKGYVYLNGKSAGKQVHISIPEARKQETVTTDASGKAVFEMPAADLIAWTPEQPKLYKVIINSGEDTVSDRIGFRTMGVKGQDILLNGKPVFWRGISLHDENPLIPGRLRSAEDMRMLLQMAKELHCNFVRLAHYPHNEEMLRLADEMGLMVWAEIPVYWAVSWEHEATWQNAAQQLTELIERDKNRASVVVWSVGNETPLGAARFQFMSRLVQKARSLDSSRLISAALEVRREGKRILVDDSLAEKLDIVSINEYGGWYWGKPEELSSYQFEIKYHKPVVISEFGADALAGYHSTTADRWSEEYQESVYRQQLRWLPALPGLRGIIPWVLMDYRSPRRLHPVYQNFWNRKGLINETGQKKKAFTVVQQFYKEMDKKYQ